MTNNSGEDVSRMFLTIGHICWRSLLMLWIKLQISTLQTKLIHLVLSLTLQMMTALQKTLRMLLDGCLVRMPVNIPDLWLDLGMKIGTKGIQTIKRPKFDYLRLQINHKWIICTPYQLNMFKFDIFFHF